MIAVTITVGTTAITALEGDLTAQDVDAIVNAANERLTHGGGVAAAIVQAGGTVIQDESFAWVHRNGPVAPGTAAVTTAGALPARVIVHVVGPRHTGSPRDAGELAVAVEAALAAAVEAGCRSVALPAISTGIFGYPLDGATRIIAGATVRWVGRHPDALDEVRLVGYDAPATAGFAAGLDATG